MTAKRRWICLTLLAGILIPFFAAIALFHVDYGEYKDFKRALKSEGFKTQKAWIYEEDGDLEDFGLYVEKTGLGFWLDVRHMSSVRSPDAKIEGILLESLHEGYENNKRAIAFSSDFWKEERLPIVSTPKEFLAHAHTILPSIYKSKAKLPKAREQFGTSHRIYKNFLIIRDDSSDLAHTIDLFDAK